MKIRTILSLLIFIISFCNLHAEEYTNVRLKDLTLEGDITLSGIVYIEGRVTVNENATLTIKAGTRLVFIYVDSDGDGIGESEILSQGRVIVNGELDNPIIFEADKKGKGRWLGFSVMTVDNESLFNHAIFEDAYMALHSHFSNINVANTIFRENLRGFQSQEGVINIHNCSFYNNNTALQFRNSKASVTNTTIYNNYGGMNFLYSDVTIENIEINNNYLFGLKARLSKANISNLIILESMQNFYSRSSEIKAKRLVSRGALLRGVSFEGSKVEIIDSEISQNLLDGISIDSTYLIMDNLTFNKNGRYDIYLKGDSKIENIENLKNIKLFKEK